jgi:hypothetical protein
MNNYQKLWREIDKYDLQHVNWYVEANTYLSQIAEHFHIDLEVVAGITSALSPGCPWKRNVTETYQFIKSNSKCRVTTYDNGLKARKILRLKRKFYWKITNILNGAKIAPFYIALMNPKNNGIPVIDTHMIRAWINNPGLNTKHREFKRIYSNNKEMNKMKEACIEIANKHSLNIHSVQAVLWSRWKRITDGRTYTNSYPIWGSLVNQVYEQQRLFANNGVNPNY